MSVMDTIWRTARAGARRGRAGRRALFRLWLRHQARHAPRHAPGSVRIEGRRIQYTDLLSLYIEYKDIFVRRIYHFETSMPAPRVIDGGACIGMAALYFKSIHPAARVLSFEPDPALHGALKRNLSGYADVQVVDAGLAAREGRAGFRSDGADGGRIVDGTRTTTDVETVRLSPYLDEPVDFLKLNIEGRELEVLEEVEAAGRLANVREMVLEYHGWAHGAQNLGKVLDLLGRNGFRYLVHDFDQETCGVTKPPFRHRPGADWFCLIHGRRVDEAMKSSERIADIPAARAA